MKPGLMGAVAALAFAATASAQEAPPATTTPATPAAPADRIVVTGMVPIPEIGEGAPYYTTEQLDTTSHDVARTRIDTISSVRKCQQARFPEEKSSRPPTLEVLFREEKDAADRALDLAESARDATAAAEKARRDAAVGLVDKAVVEKAELDRQAAVNKLDPARMRLLEASAAIADYEDLKRSGRTVDRFDLDDRADLRRKAGWNVNGAPPQEFAGLKITAITVRELTDPKKGKFVRVSGELHNERDKPAETPRIRVSLIDARGWTVGALTQGASNGAKLKPGSVKPFVFDMRPAPDSMEKALVTFASDIDPPPPLPVGLFPECREKVPDEVLPLVRDRGLGGGRGG